MTDTADQTPADASAPSDAQHASTASDAQHASTASDAQHASTASEQDGVAALKAEIAALRETVESLKAATVPETDTAPASTMPRTPSVADLPPHAKIAAGYK